MKVIDAGHVYHLDNLGAPGYQELKFCKRSSHHVKHDVEYQGTNTQEVIRALLDRSVYLDGLIPCDETKDAIWHLQQALHAYEARALRRKQQRVNGGAEHAEARERYRDIPFCPEEVEDMNVGDDGHVLIMSI